MKIVISDPKTGRTYQKDVEGSLLIGRKIGEELDGGSFGFAGYKLKITGGSDNSGFPMRKDIQGQRKTRAFLSSPPGFRPARKGERRKKMVRGNALSNEITQVNAMIVSYGEKPIQELSPAKEENKDAT